MAISTTVAQTAGTDRPSLGEKLTYASGEIASNLVWNMVNGYLLYYYSDIVYLPVAALGTLMLLTRVLDALVDPVVGITVDRTRTRWGQARPYLLFASIPFGVLCVLTFAVPDWQAPAKLIYAYVTFTILGLLYSVVYIPYGALQPMMARDPSDKAQISSLRAMCTSLGSIVVYGAIPWIVNLAGPANKPAGYLIAAIVFSTLTSGLYLLVFARTRERFSTLTNAALPGRRVSADLANLVRNPVWLFLFFYALISFVRLGSFVSVVAYYVNSVLHQPWMMAVVLPLLSVSMFLGGLLSAFIIRQLGQRRANALMLLVSVVLQLLMPYSVEQPIVFMALFFGANLYGGVVGATFFASTTDAVMYQERRTGVGNEGLVCSSLSFGMKVGMAVGTALTAYILAWVGYDPHAVTTRAAEAVREIFFYGPVFFGLLQLLVIWIYRAPAQPTVPAPAP